jgi:hypothetical protein
MALTTEKEADAKIPARLCRAPRKEGEVFHVSRQRETKFMILWVF